MNFEEFYKTSRLRFYKFFLNRTYDSYIAEDLTQDFFLKVYLNLEKFDENKALFDAWLFTIAKNILIDFYRKNKYTNSSNKLSIREEDCVEDFKYSELFYFYNKEIQKMKKAKSDCFVMLYEGYSIKEIEKFMRISNGTVKSRIFKTREILKEKLKEFIV